MIKEKSYLDKKNKEAYEDMLNIANEWGKGIDCLTVDGINNNILNNPKEFIEKSIKLFKCIYMFF